MLLARVRVWYVVGNRRAGLPRSPLAITLLGWAWAHLRTRPARNAAP